MNSIFHQNLKHFKFTESKPRKDKADVLEPCIIIEDDIEQYFGINVFKSFRMGNCRENLLQRGRRNQVMRGYKLRICQILDSLTQRDRQLVLVVTPVCFVEKLNGKRSL